MRGGVLQLHRWGLLDRIVDAGTPPIRRTTFRYAHDDVVRARSSRVTASMRSTRLAAPCSIPFWSMPPSRPERTCATASPSPMFAATPTAASSASRARRDRSTARIRCRHRDRRRWPAVDGRRTSRRPDRAPWRRARRLPRLRLLVRRGDRRLRMGLPRRRGAGLDPDERRAHVRVRRRTRRPASAAGAVWPSTTSSAALRPRWRSASPPADHRRVFAPSPVTPASCGERGARVGRWSAMPARGRTRSAPTASPTPSRDAELLSRAIVASASGEAAEREALSGYQAVRDRLTLPLLTLADAVSAYDWTDDEIPVLFARSQFNDGCGHRGDRRVRRGRRGSAARSSLT